MLLPKVATGTLAPENGGEYSVMFALFSLYKFPEASNASPKGCATPVVMLKAGVLALVSGGLNAAIELLPDAATYKLPAALTATSSGWLSPVIVAEGTLVALSGALNT